MIYNKKTSLYSIKKPKQILESNENDVIYN